MNEMLHKISVVPEWLWWGFGVAVVILLIIDLSLFGKLSKNNHSKVKIALVESAMWVLVALAFNLWFGMTYGKELGVQFLTGYLVEKSLSVDNLFVILLIFSSFKISDKHQHKVLFYAIANIKKYSKLNIILRLHHLFSTTYKK